MNKFYVVEGVVGAGAVYLGFDDEGASLVCLKGALIYTDKEDAVYDCDKATSEFKGVVFKVRECVLTLGEVV